MYRDPAFNSAGTLPQFPTFFDRFRERKAESGFFSKLEETGNRRSGCDPVLQRAGFFRQLATKALSAGRTSGAWIGWYRPTRGVL